MSGKPVILIISTLKDQRINCVVQGTDMRQKIKNYWDNQILCFFLYCDIFYSSQKPKIHICITEKRMHVQSINMKDCGKIDPDPCIMTDQRLVNDVSVLLYDYFSRTHLGKPFHATDHTCAGLEMKSKLNKSFAFIDRNTFALVM